MGKMSELSMLLDDLIDCGRKLTETAQALKDFYSSPDEAPAAKPAAKSKKKTPEPVKEEEPEKTYTKEDVRALLSRTANENGGKHKAEVRDIVRKYGNGGSLTDVDAKDYPALVAEVEGLKDA